MRPGDVVGHRRPNQDPHAQALRHHALAAAALATPAAAPGLRILFLVSAHNSLSQRAQVALTELGHDVSGRGRGLGRRDGGGGRAPSSPS